MNKSSPYDGATALAAGHPKDIVRPSRRIVLLAAVSAVVVLLARLMFKTGFLESMAVALVLATLFFLLIVILVRLVEVLTYGE